MLVALHLQHSAQLQTEALAEIAEQIQNVKNELVQELLASRQLETQSLRELRNLAFCFSSGVVYYILFNPPGD